MVTEEEARKTWAMPLKLMELHLAFEDQGTIYKKRKEIPENLKPASYFLKYKWFQDELVATGAYISESGKQGWALYPTSEEKRIINKYPQRFRDDPEEGEGILIGDRWRAFMGLDTLCTEPYIERYSQRQNEWYYKWLFDYSEYLLLSKVFWINAQAHKVELRESPQGIEIIDTVTGEVTIEPAKQAYETLRPRKNLPRQCKKCGSYPTIATLKNENYGIIATLKNENYGIIACHEGEETLTAKTGQVLFRYYTGTDFSQILKDWNWEN